MASLQNQAKEAALRRSEVWIRDTLREVALQSLSEVIQGDSIDLEQISKVRSQCRVVASRWSVALKKHNQYDLANLVDTIAEQGEQNLYHYKSDAPKGTPEPKPTSTQRQCITTLGRLRRLEINSKAVNQIDEWGRQGLYDGAPYYSWDEVLAKCNEREQKTYRYSKKNTNSQPAPPKQEVARPPWDHESINWSTEEFYQQLHTSELDQLTEFPTPNSTMVGAALPVGRVHFWLQPPKQISWRRSQNRARKERLGFTDETETEASYILHTMHNDSQGLDLDLAWVSWETHNQVHHFSTLEVQLDWKGEIAAESSDSDDLSGSNHSPHAL